MLNKPICFVALLTVALFSGCGPQYTYPAAKVPESIEKIAKDEYKLTVQARVVGKTVGALFYVDKMIDESGQMAKDVQEKMGKMVQVVSRVALSSDAKLDFGSVVIRDKDQGNELVVTRSLDDTKRAQADALGFEEALNRTLISPGKYAKDALESMPFPLKEVKLETFLAEQIAQRVRYGFAQEPPKKDSKKKTEEVEDDLGTGFVLVDGTFENVQGKKGFKFSILSMKTEDPKGTILSVFKTVNNVLAGYQYTDFDEVEIQDYLNRQKLILDKETLLNYQKHKIKDTEILAKFLQESQTIQDSFKMFGFQMPADSSEKEETALIPSAS